MYCKKIKLTNFRNISEAEIDFCDGINILAGENAQGKTNLLEAIFYASVGRSFRASSANEMILFGKKNATVSVDYMSEKKERHDNITIHLFSDKKKTVEKNHLRIERLSDIVGSFRSVLFCPEHLSLIKDGPLERRTYLDIAISRISPKYIHSLQRYSYLLKQRNALIKSAVQNRDAFFCNYRPLVGAACSRGGGNFCSEASICKACRSHCFDLLCRYDGQKRERGNYLPWLCRSLR